MYGPERGWLGGCRTEKKVLSKAIGCRIRYHEAPQAGEGPLVIDVQHWPKSHMFIAFSSREGGGVEG